jgi:deoxyribodipyrimidine photo-lyase
LPAGLVERWPRLRDEPRDLPIDRSVGRTPTAGGPRAAEAVLRRFASRIDRYAKERNQPDVESTSSLSPYLHFGHIASHEVCAMVLDLERWTPDQLAKTASGSRAGWWGLSHAAEAFLDQVVTWRELGFNMCRHRYDYDQYGSLPSWALATLDDHSMDAREYVYSLEQFEAAETHDALWNAAQRQLVREGTIQNYLRMLWGKKILEWCDSPRDALDVMIELNNKYALDGRDPNSYSGILWVLGRYDRAWGPERAIFGKVRFMSSANTARKLKLEQYLKRYGPTTAGVLHE